MKTGGTEHTLTLTHTHTLTHSYFQAHQGQTPHHSSAHRLPTGHTEHLRGRLCGPALLVAMRMEALWKITPNLVTGLPLGRARWWQMDRRDTLITHSLIHLEPRETLSFPPISRRLKQFLRRCHFLSSLPSCPRVCRGGHSPPPGAVSRLTVNVCLSH